MISITTLDFQKITGEKKTTTGDLLTTLKTTLTCVNSLDQKPLLCTYCKTVKNNILCTSSLKKSDYLYFFKKIWKNLTFILKKNITALLLYQTKLLSKSYRKLKKE